MIDVTDVRADSGDMLTSLCRVSIRTAIGSETLSQLNNLVSFLFVMASEKGTIRD